MSTALLESLLKSIDETKFEGRPKTKKEKQAEFYINSLPPGMDLTEAEKKYYGSNHKNVSKTFDIIDQKGRDNNQEYIIDQGNTGTCWLVSAFLALSMFPIGAQGRYNSNHHIRAAKNREVVKSFLYMYLGSTELCPTFPSELNFLNISTAMSSEYNDIRVFPSTSNDKSLFKPIPSYLEPLKALLQQRKKVGDRDYICLDSKDKLFSQIIVHYLHLPYNQIHTKQYYFIDEKDNKKYKIVIKYKPGGQPITILSELFRWAGYYVVNKSINIDWNNPYQAAALYIEHIDVRNIDVSLNNVYSKFVNKLVDYDTGVIDIKWKRGGGHAICFYRKNVGPGKYTAYFIDSHNSKPIIFTHQNIQKYLRDRGGNLISIYGLRRPLEHIPPKNSRHIRLHSTMNNIKQDKEEYTTQLVRLNIVLNSGNEFKQSFTQLFSKEPPSSEEEAKNIIQQYIISYKMKLFYIDEEHNLMKNLCKKYICEDTTQLLQENNKDFQKCRDILYDTIGSDQDVHTVRAENCDSYLPFPSPFSPRERQFNNNSVGSKKDVQTSSYPTYPSPISSRERQFNNEFNPERIHTKLYRDRPY